MNIYFDTEFTQLVQDTTLISIGMVADNGKEFYAELTDYNQDLVDEWITEHVINNLLFNDEKPFAKGVGAIQFVKSDMPRLRNELTLWLNQFEHVNLWSDVMHYDMTLFQGIFGGAFGVPEHVNYIGFDIATVMQMFGLNPDTEREAFIDRPIDGVKHNSLYDARVIQACYQKLQRNRDKYKIVL